MDTNVVIVGGGLAGLSAAVSLAKEGLPVTVIERKPFLGGRATSYPIIEDHASKEHVDNGQHILMQCCTNLLDFYRRVGVEGGIRFSDRIAFLSPEGVVDALRASRLPAPLHLLPSFLRLRGLDGKSKRAVVRALAAMLLVRDSPELDRVTMLDWLRKHGQTDAAVERFWAPILVSALNEDIDKASALYGILVFREGILKHPEAYKVGVPALPLAQLWAEPASRFLARYGGEVRLRSTAAQMEIEGSLVSNLFLSDGTRLPVDYCISSITPDALLRLLPEEVVKSNDCFQRLRHLEMSPITSVYLWLEEPPTDLEFAAMPGRVMQWIFSKHPAGELPCVGLVVSASRDLLRLSRGRILEIALEDLHSAFPASRKLKVRRGTVIKEPFATFSCRAGAEMFRPDQRTPLANLFLAGDWTRTGWPATMESAVRSGYRCAELVLERKGRPSQILQPALPARGLSRLFF